MSQRWKVLVGLTLIFSIGALSAFLATGDSSGRPCTKRHPCPTTSTTTTTDQTPPPPGCNQVIRQGDGQSPYSFFNAAIGPVICVRGVITGNIDLPNPGVTVQTEPGYQRATLYGYQQVKPTGKNVTLRDLKLDGSGVTSIGVRVYADDFTLGCQDLPYPCAEVTNSHLGESCMNLSNYSGSLSGPIYRPHIYKTWIHACGRAGDGRHDHGIYDAYGYNGEVSDTVIEDICCGHAVNLWTSAHNEWYHHDLFQNLNNADAWSGDAVEFAGASNPSSNNIVEWSISRNVATFHATEYWQSTPGSGNAFRNNCLDTAPSGDYYETPQVGYTASGNVHDEFCVGYGPR